LIKYSKLIWSNKSALIMSLYCLVVVLFGFFIRFIWENERSVVQFVTINMSETAEALKDTIFSISVCIVPFITFKSWIAS
jgi:hypothetical protein